MTNKVEMKKMELMNEIETAIADLKWTMENNFHGVGELYVKLSELLRQIKICRSRLRTNFYGDETYNRVFKQYYRIRTEFENAVCPLKEVKKLMGEKPLSLESVKRNCGELIEKITKFLDDAGHGLDASTALCSSRITLQRILRSIEGKEEIPGMAFELDRRYQFELRKFNRLTHSGM